MRQDSVRRAFGAVVADEDGGVEGSVNALHHHQRAWPGAHKAGRGIEFVDEDVLGVAVGIGDDDFRGTSF